MRIICLKHLTCKHVINQKMLWPPQSASTDSHGVADPLLNTFALQHKMWQKFKLKQI